MSAAIETEDQKRARLLRYIRGFQTDCHNPEGANEWLEVQATAKLENIAWALYIDALDTEE